MDTDNAFEKFKQQIFNPYWLDGVVSEWRWEDPQTGKKHNLVNLITEEKAPLNVGLVNLTWLMLPSKETLKRLDHLQYATVTYKVKLAATLSKVEVGKTTVGTLAALKDLQEFNTEVSKYDFTNKPDLIRAIVSKLTTSQSRGESWN